MNSKFNHNLRNVLNWLKLQLKFMVIGIVTIAAIGLGFIAVITGSIIAPAFRWLKSKISRRDGLQDDNFNSKTSRHDRDDFIDVEYEVLDDDEK